MRRLLLIHVLLLVLSLLLPGQDHHERFESIDVLSYRYFLSLYDHTDEIQGMADIEISFKKDVDQFQLDLSGGLGEQGGMKVTGITEDGQEVPFLHQDDHLILTIAGAREGTQRTYSITYSGIPSDGLIISENKFGDRTFFGDNWPNRGHNWLPMVDHPSDKALV